MLFFSHIGFTLIIMDTIRNLLNKQRFSLIDLLIITIGSLLPDFFDKLVFYPFFMSGRALAHSIIFQILLFITFHFIYRSKALILFFSTSIHLLLDSAGYLPLFWPLSPVRPSKDLFSSFIQMYTNFDNILLEIIGAFGLFLVFMEYREQIKGGLNVIAKSKEMS